MARYRHMMSKISFYKTLYIAAIKTCTEYRIDFILNILTAVGMQLAALSFFWIVFSKTTLLGGWNNEEVLMLFGLSAMAVAVSELCSNGIWMLPFYIVNGEMDRLMVYPVRGLVFLLVSRPELHALGNMAAGAAMAVIASQKMGLEFSQWALIPLWVVCAGVVYTGFLIMLACISFFAVGPWSNPIMAGFHLHNASRYPLHIFPHWLRMILMTLYPVGLAIYLPVKWLKGEIPAWQGLGGPLLALLISISASMLIWNYSLKRYQSTGS